MALPSPSLDASRAMSNFTRISGPDGVGIRTPFGKAPSSFISNFSLVSLHIALHTPSGVFSVMSMLIGCCLMIAIQWYPNSQFFLPLLRLSGELVISSEGCFTLKDSAGS